MRRSATLRFIPATFLLESRDVPATFYVDTQFVGVANGTSMTFNVNSPNSKPNVLIGTNGFATLNAALTAAAANNEADTIYLSRSRDANDTPFVTVLDNSAGPIVIDDNVTIIGSGQGATTLTASTDTANSSTALFDVAANRTVSFQDLSLTGLSRNIGVGFSFNNSGVVGSLTNVSVSNINFGTVDGTCVAAGSGAALNVTNSDISQYGRIGVSYSSATGTVSGSTFTGWGTGVNFIGYGIQLAGAASVQITGNTIINNTASVPAPNLSAAINLFEVNGNAPTATITKNTITGNTFGIKVGGAQGTDRSQASIHSNNLNGNFVAVQADNVQTVDATNNWFGSATGPFEVTTNTAGLGSEVTDQVNYANFLTAPFVNTVTVPGPTVTVPGPTVTVPGPTTIVNAPPKTTYVAVGGNGTAQLVRSGDLANALSVTTFDGNWRGAVSVAQGDVTGDGTPDLIVAAGVNGGPRVQVFDGKTGAVLLNFFAFPQAFVGGVTVAVGDITGGGYGDIIVGAGAGGTPNVRVFDGKSGALIRDFLPFDASFRGGVSVAAGDITGKGYANIVTGAGAGGAPVVRVFDGRSGAMLEDYLTFAADFRGGVNVAVGNVTGSGLSVITAAQQGGGPAIRLQNGQTGQTQGTYAVDAASTVGGFKIAAGDLDGDGLADITFAGGSLPNQPRVTFAKNIAVGNFQPTAFGRVFAGPVSVG